MDGGFDGLLATAGRIAGDLWTKGWAERNAGNMSVRLRESELPGDAGEAGPWLPLTRPVPGAAGERFLLTATGSRMRLVATAPRRDLGVVEVRGDGAAVRTVWGFEGGAAPTSELPAHLLAQEARARASGGEDRAVLHTHPTSLIALTYARDLDTRSLSLLLWGMHTECIVFFPEGCGFVPWRLPGSDDLAEATAEVLARRRLALWQHHGLVATGPDPDAAFGLVETAEKAAAIWLAAAAAGPVTRSLTPAQLRALAERFGVRPDEGLLTL